MELLREFGVFFLEMLFAIVLLLFGIQTPPAGAISGRVFDTERKPLPGVTVQLVRRMYQNGRPILLTVQQATTDQNGRYRFDALEPGRYRVSVQNSRIRDDARAGSSGGRAWSKGVPAARLPPRTAWAP